MVIGLLFGNVPAVNSIESVYRCMDRTFLRTSYN
jgi:hypothetical protein